MEVISQEGRRCARKSTKASNQIWWKEYGLTTLETRKRIGDQKEVLKILNVYEMIDRNICFSVKEDRTFTLAQAQR